MSQDLATDTSQTPDESTVMVVWPSIAAFAVGRWVGQLAGIRAGYGIATVGNLLALLTIPISLVVFVWRLLPGAIRRYRLTTTRILVQRGIVPVEERSVGLDEFEAIEIEFLPGQRWLRAGELVFKRNGSEVFRLSGVPHPLPFQQVCLKTRSALIAVQKALEIEATLPEANPTGAS